MIPITISISITIAPVEGAPGRYQTGRLLVWSSTSPFLERARADRGGVALLEGRRNGRPDWDLHAALGVAAGLVVRETANGPIFSAAGSPAEHAGEPSHRGDRGRRHGAPHRRGAAMSAPIVERKRLPNRRGHEVVEFEHSGFVYTAGVGRFSDGQLAEVFLTGAKVGTSIETQARDAAITASLCFQMGGSPETLGRALTRNADGSASGPLGRLLDLLLLEDGGGLFPDRLVRAPSVVADAATDVLSPDGAA
jgi:hypothetical protein